MSQGFDLVLAIVCLLVKGISHGIVKEEAKRGFMKH